MDSVCYLSICLRSTFTLFFCSVKMVLGLLNIFSLPDGAEALSVEGARETLQNERVFTSSTTVLTLQEILQHAPLSRIWLLQCSWLLQPQALARFPAPGSCSAWQPAATSGQQLSISWVAL